MIGRLFGTIEHQETDGGVIVDVHGVGYEVFVPPGAVGRLKPDSDQRVVLHIHTHVRDDAMTLFGFASREDRAAFRALLKVSSIGPKLALSIMGALGAAELQAAVNRQDKLAFKGITGVGKRTVERLLVDLQGKLDFVEGGVTGVRLRAVGSDPEGAPDKVVGALVQMGYKRNEAEAAVDSAAEASSDDNVEGLLRAALSALS